MNPRSIVAIIATGLLAATAPAHPQDPAIVVSAPPSLTQWMLIVSDKLDRGLRYPTEIFGIAPTGIVSVRFECSDEGKPSIISIAHTSGYRALDRSAMRAVAGIKTLHPIPIGMKSDQHYIANILFASSQYEYDQHIGEMKREAIRRNKWFVGADRQAIVITPALQTPGRSPLPAGA